MRRKKKKLKIILSSLFLLGGIFLLSQMVSLSDAAASFGITFTKRETATTKHGWNLILVNDDYCIPEDYEVTLKTLANGEQIDERIYPYLQEMFNAARAEGIYPIVREGYRTEKEQQALYDEKVQAYINEGYSRSRAEKTAKEWVALPGTSEHQLGIAVDINADKSKCSNNEVYAWLAENAHEYGFILRYPQGKLEMTGISYEPWHYRYVGVDAAQEIYNENICLEEYLE